MSSSIYSNDTGVYANRVFISSDKSAHDNAQTLRLQRTPSTSSRANPSYPNNPFLKMPDQGSQEGSSSAPSGVAHAMSIQEAPNHGHRSHHPNLKVPKQHQAHPAMDFEASKRKIRPLSQAGWEQIADKTEEILPDDTNHIVDCFVNAQQAIAELEKAIHGTAHRTDLSASVKVATQGLDALNCDLFQVITKSLDQTREREYYT